MRDVEIINSKTAEIKSMENDVKTLRDLLYSQKEQKTCEQESNRVIIDNLCRQLAD
jgi:hypothetical protein